MALPEVNEDVLDTMLVQFRSQEYCESMILRMVAENPVVLRFIQTCGRRVKRDVNEEWGEIVTKMLFCMYKMLENQDDANELERLIG